VTPALIAVMGPTASGKSALAEEVAGRLDALLLNADAFQVYRGLDIGTNKPVDRARYRLLDIVGPDEEFGVGRYVRLAQAELESAFKAARSVVVVGGTGLYVRALFQEYRDLQAAPDPSLRSELAGMSQEAAVERLLGLDPDTTVDVANPVRVRRALERLLAPTEPVSFSLPPFRRLKVALWPDLDSLTPKIVVRTQDMWDRGWPQEARSLESAGIPRSAPGFRAIGYQSVFQHLDGRLDREEAERAIVADTRRYAKRQLTWLRSEPDLERAQEGSVAAWVLGRLGATIA
jgi:tRNA dimethylallyltransferase